MVTSLQDKLKQNIVKSINSKFFDKNIDVKAIYLFGSYAAGTATNASDIDIAVRCKGKTPWPISNISKLDCE